MSTSLAVQAHCQQNLNERAPDSTRFPGHDTFQNGIIPNGQPTTFYTAATNEDIENIKARKSNMSGFLTDGDTVDSCRNADGVLDANLYADKTQTQPWKHPDAPPRADYTYRENVVAFNVNWDRLNAPENAELRARLCDADGNLRCAYGKTEANTHWGAGGANQYYFNRDDFNAAVNSDIFEYDDSKTSKEDDGTLVRHGVSPAEYRAMEADRQDSINNQLSSCPDPLAISDIDKARALNEITPQKAAEINSAQAAEGNYLAIPDPAYNYSKNDAASVSGTPPPQDVSNSPTGPPGVAGELPPQSSSASSEKVGTTGVAGELPQPKQTEVQSDNPIAGTLPSQHNSIVSAKSEAVAGELPQSPKTENHQDNQIAGTTPDKAQSIELPSDSATSAAGKGLAESSAKNPGEGFDPNSGIT